MATDFVVVIFQLPILLAVLVLAATAFFGRKRGVGPSSFLGIGRTRLALGYLAAAGVTLAYAGVDSWQLAQEKVALGHVTASEATARWAGWSLYLFVVATPFVVVGLTVFGLPALAALRRIGFASLAGLVASALAFSAAVAGWALLAPYNVWCSSHASACALESFDASLALGVPVAVAFALGARLPWLRSASLPANNSSKPTPLRGAA
ncbi:hypothetical protein [Lysobacter sp. HA35]